MTPAARRSVVSRLLDAHRIDMSRRNFGLDVARAVAIGLVIVAHGTQVAPFAGERWMHLGGYFGVELFFALSGFLIGRILLRQLDAHTGQPGWSLLEGFWIRRWFRTLPNYYLFLVLNIVLYPSLAEVPFSLHLEYFGFAQNLAWRAPAMMGESWSLAVEEWFYLLCPLTLVVACRFTASRRAATLGGVLVFIAVFTGLRLWAALAPDLQWDQISTAVLFRLDAIGYGVLLAHVDHHHPDGLRRHAGLLGLAGAGLLVALVGLLVRSVLHGSTETLFNRFWLFPFTSIGFTCLLPWLQRLRPRAGRLAALVTQVSVVSYAMYLTHLSLAVPLIRRCFPAATSWPLPFLAYALLTWLISTVVYVVFERRATSLRERYAGGVPAPGEGAPSRRAARLAVALLALCLAAVTTYYWSKGDPQWDLEAALAAAAAHDYQGADYQHGRARVGFSPDGYTLVLDTRDAPRFGAVAQLTLIGGVGDAGQLQLVPAPGASPPAWDSLDAYLRRAKLPVAQLEGAYQAWLEAQAARRR